jgi:ATP/maltotriose-dependent transcriptional regulator MalT
MLRFLHKLQLLLGRKRFRDELAEEMEFHRAAAEREFVEEGMTAEAARYAAKRQFGIFVALLTDSPSKCSCGYLVSTVSGAGRIPDRHD